MAGKNGKKGGKASTKAVMKQLHRDTMSRAVKVKVPTDPPAVLNSGDVWHSRKVITTTLAAADGTTNLTAGAIVFALSGNAANVPLRIVKMCCWAIAGTAGTYPPTFIQVDFKNEEFMQNGGNTPSGRDSITDAGGMGAGCPGVGLYIPDSQRLIRADWGTGSTTVVATALGLPSGARVLWHVTLQFKF